MSKRLIKFADYILFILLLYISSKAMFHLFLNQAITVDGTFFSDIKAYIQEVMGTNEMYDFPYPIMFKTAGFLMRFVTYPELAMAYTITLYNVLAIIITKIFITIVTKERIISTVVTYALFFSSMIYSDIISLKTTGYYYLGVFTPNPWHNGTYMAARPFMILAFIFGAITVARYEEDFSKKISIKVAGIYIAYAISLFLVTETKPSYTVIHLFTLAFIMLYRFIRSRFGNFKQSLLYALCYVPTLIGLLGQYSGVFQGESARGETNGLGIELFRVWNLYTTNLPVSLILAAAFPFVVLVIHFKLLKNDSKFRFAWQIYLSGLLTSIVFYEKGFREGHFNFAWGYMCGLFIVFLYSFIVWIKDVKTLQIKDKVLLAKSSAMIILETVPMIAHVALGVKYFIYLSKGGLYY